MVSASQQIMIGQAHDPIQMYKMMGSKLERKMFFCMKEPAQKQETIPIGSYSPSLEWNSRLSETSQFGKRI